MTSQTNEPQNHLGFSLKCKFRFRGCGFGYDSTFLTCSRRMLILLAHGPHLQKEVSTGFPLKVSQGLEELPTEVPSSVAFFYWSSLLPYLTTSLRLPRSPFKQTSCSTPKNLLRLGFGGPPEYNTPLYR